MRQAMRGITILTIVLLLTGSAWAAAAVQGEVRIIFSSEERKIIREYYSKEIVEKAWEQTGKGEPKGKRGLPPGLAKKGKLPPGLQKHLQRNGTLPPGLQKRLEPLPREVEVRLKPLPPDHVRVVIGTDVIILDKTTQKVLDIIRDVAVLARDIAR